MKYLKICSFAVLALLLFAPQAQSAVTCTIGTNLQEIRMESGAEEVEDLKVTCTWTTASDIATITAPANGDPNADPPTPDTSATGPKFDLELDFNGMVAKDPANAKQMPTLLLKDLTGNDLTANNNATGASKITTVDKDGNRSPASTSEVSGRSILWTDVVFPATWAVGTANASGSFTIDNLHLDASSVNNDRLNATIVLTATGIDTEDEADVARIKQALDLEFSEDNKAQKFNACEPGSKAISINVMEGFRKAWRSGNDIMLMTSSGTIEAKDTGILDVTAEGGAGELIIDVGGAAAARDDSTDLAITFKPAMGGSGDITLSAMLLPMRRTDESFVKSADLVVGSFDVCKGDKLFFPFVTSRSGWDTGIVVVNNSKIDGSCSLNWGDMDLEADEMAALSTIDVDAKDHQAFLVSMERAADYSGSLGVQCTFSSATGYVFLSDSANGIGQGYLVNP